MNKLSFAAMFGLGSMIPGGLFDIREESQRPVMRGAKKKASKSDKARRKNSAKGAKAARR